MSGNLEKWLQKRLLKIWLFLASNSNIFNYLLHDKLKPTKYTSQHILYSLSRWFLKNHFPPQLFWMKFIFGFIVDIRIYFFTSFISQYLVQSAVEYWVHTPSRVSSVKPSLPDNLQRISWISVNRIIEYRVFKIHAYRCFKANFCGPKAQIWISKDCFQLLHERKSEVI